MIQVSPEKLRWWISVLEFDPHPEVIIPEMQALLLEAGEKLQDDEDTW